MRRATHSAHQANRSCRLIRLLVVGCLLAAGSVVVTASPVLAGTKTELPPGFDSIVVDAARQYVYASSPQSHTVTVLDFSGRIVKIIDNEPGAAGMALVGNVLYVALNNAGSVDAIDTTTLTRTRRMATEALFKPRSLVYAGGKLWTMAGGDLASIEPVTGAFKRYSPMSNSDSYLITGNPADPNMLIGWNPGISSATLNKWDVSTDPPTLVLTQNTGFLANLRDVAISPDGTKIFPASGSPYEIDEFRVSDLKPAGLVYTTGPYPIAAAATAAKGGLMAAGLNAPYDPDIHLFQLGNPARKYLTFDFGQSGGTLFDRSLAFTPDGSRLFAVSGTGSPYQGEGPARFHVINTEPIRASGTGYNGSGQVGDTTRTDRVTPTPVSSMSDVDQLSAGLLHSAAVKNDGTVWSWGSNSYGMLGNGTTADRLTPNKVGDLNNMVAVSSGMLHTLALQRDGSVWAWGYNGLGQLGDGTKIDRLAPVRVTQLSGVVAISAGAFHSVAVKADGTVWSWGWNALGQLGTGDLLDRVKATQVSAVGGATSVSAGGYHSLARTEDGEVYAWGWNGLGQLGVGTTTDSTTPRLVPGISDAMEVSAGYAHSMVLNSADAVKAWGWNALGQLGDGSAIDRSRPVPVASGGPVETISAGFLHSMAVVNGQGKAWGWNAYGQLGDGTTTDRNRPAAMTGTSSVFRVSAGGLHSLVAHTIPMP